MNDAISELAGLAARVERMTGGHSDAELTERKEVNEIIHAMQPEPKVVVPLDYCASLDAAMSLVPEGWTRTVKWSAENEGYALVYDPSIPDDTSIYAVGKTMALALTAAALRAHLASLAAAMKGEG